MLFIIFFIGIAEPPKALESHVQVIVTKGSNLTLNCPVVGWPKPFINWYSSGGIIVATNKSSYVIYVSILLWNYLYYYK